MTEKVYESELSLPNAPSFRALYDPTNSLDDGSLLELLKSTRQEPVYVQGAGNLTGSPLLAAEGAHILMSPRAVSDFLVDLNPAEVDTIFDGVERGAEEVANTVVQTVATIREQESSRAQTNIVKFAELPSNITLAGMVLAAGVHKGIRKSGRAYYTHPQEVAAILQVAWNKFKPSDQSKLDELLFLAYVHDTFEEAFTQNGTSFLATPTVLVSPLIVKKTFEAFGSDTGLSAAHSLMLLTKPTTADGTPMPYMQYTERGNQDFNFIMTKLADTHHNLRIEPKSSFSIDTDELGRIASKKMLYSRTQSMLLRSGEETNNIDAIFMMHSILTVTRDEIRNQIRRQNPIKAQKMAELFEANLAQIRAQNL